MKKARVLHETHYRNLVLEPIGFEEPLEKGATLLFGKKAVAKVVETFGRVESPLFLAEPFEGEKREWAGKELGIKEPPKFRKREAGARSKTNE